LGIGDLALFWMLNSLSHAGVVGLENWNDEVAALLSAFPCVGDGFDPLQDGSLSTLRIRLLKTAQLRRKVEMREKSALESVATDDLLYRPGNQYLIDVFGITLEEQKHMRTIISQEEKRRRRDAVAPGRERRRLERQMLRERVYEWLKERNWVCDSVSALARSIGVDVAKAWRCVRFVLGKMAKGVEGVAPNNGAQRCDAGWNVQTEARPTVACAESTKPSTKPAASSTQAKGKEGGRASISGHLVKAKEFMVKSLKRGLFDGVHRRRSIRDAIAERMARRQDSDASFDIDPLDAFAKDVDQKGSQGAKWRKVLFGC